MLEIKNLYKSFGKKKVLKGINLKIEEGEVIGIIGPSGCGKSTLLRSINFLEKKDSGQINFLGKEIDNNTNLSVYRQNIGMLFQKYNLFNNMTVLDNIVLAPVKLKLMDKKEAISIAKELLSKINLLDKINEYPYSLSGGEAQRIAMIRALIMKPKLLLFDEPTSALDPENIDEVEALIKEIAKEKMTMIIVSHDINFIKEIATRMIFMDDGLIIENEKTSDFFNSPKNQRLKAFLSKVNR